MVEGGWKEIEQALKIKLYREIWMAGKSRGRINP
jgi:hypothetical protein